jgi:enoyl-CoA hydratase
MLPAMIHVEDRGTSEQVRLVTIDRPDRRNALDRAAVADLHAAVDAVRERIEADTTRVLVIAGAGGHFCAGADLSGVEDETFVAELHALLVALRDLPLPTIAAIEGAALGAGTQLAAACDLRSATDDATFGIPAAKLGLMVDQWTIRRLGRLAGQGPARAMLLAAQTYSGAEARTFGFVQRAGGVDDALVWADAVAALAPLTIAGHKVGLNEAEHDGDDDPPPSDAFATALAAAWGSEDLQEGLTAFRSRRPATFSRR